jgi:hypothetical protein
MKLKRPSPAMVVSVVALVMSMTGGALAAVNYARNAGAVDGKSAVKASASNGKAAGKLVATTRSGADRGKIPFKFLAGAASAASVSSLADMAARARNTARVIEVSDNQVTVAETLIDLELGNFQVSCYDEAQAAGKENAATRITITNHSGFPMNIARRVGVGDAQITTLPNNVVDTFDVGAQNTFHVQLQGAVNKTVTLDGTARQAGQGTPESACGVWATAIIVQ